MALEHLYHDTRGLPPTWFCFPVVCTLELRNVIARRCLNPEEQNPKLKNVAVQSCHM